jgi:hypothetical protein
VLRAQEKWHDSNDAYARDFHALRSLGNMRAEITIDADGTARSDAGEFNFRLRLVSDGEHYVLLVRPDGWPERGHWKQYALQPDGKLWQTSDSGDWATNDPAFNPKQAGWEFVTRLDEGR